VTGVVNPPTANWTIRLSASPAVGGSVSGGGTFANGATVPVSAAANSGYVFANWTEAGNVVSTQASYTLTASASRSLVASFTPTSTGPIVLQPGPASGTDVWISSSYGGTDNDILRVGGWSDYYHSLISFDLNGLPANATSAVLHLYARPNTGSVTSTAMYLDRVTSGWTESTKWASQPGAVQISTLPASSNAGGWYTIDLTSLYNGWKSGAFSNHGIQLRPQNISNNYCEFFSSDYLTDPSLRPKLVIAAADTTAPVMQSGAVDVDARQVRLTASENIAGDILGSATLTRIGGGAPVQLIPSAVAGSGITFALPASLPDGNYRLTLPAGYVGDLAGNRGTTPFNFDFHILAGDANRDRRVDFEDLLALARNYGQSGRTFSQGNFDYSADGVVGFDDLLILARRYGTTLVAPATAASPSVGSDDGTRRNRSTAADVVG
jgi:hypothetical protein